MKRSLILTLFITQMVLNVSAQIGTIKHLDERNGYKAVTLGDTITNIPINKLVPIKNLQNIEFKFYYYDDEASLQLSDNVVLDHVILQVYKGKIYSIKLIFNRLLGLSIKNVFDSAYGIGSQSNQYLDRYLWSSNNVILELNYDNGTSQGYADFSCIFLMKKYLKELRTSAQKAATDL